jgi:hypothetical protein
MKENVSGVVDKFPFHIYIVPNVPKRPTLGRKGEPR